MQIFFFLEYFSTNNRLSPREIKSCTSAARREKLSHLLLSVCWYARRETAILLPPKHISTQVESFKYAGHSVNVPLIYILHSLFIIVSFQKLQNFDLQWIQKHVWFRVRQRKVRPDVQKTRRCFQESGIWWRCKHHWKIYLH